MKNFFAKYLDFSKLFDFLKEKMPSLGDFWDSLSSFLPDLLGGSKSSADGDAADDNKPEEEVKTEETPDPVNETEKTFINFLKGAKIKDEALATKFNSFAEQIKTNFETNTSINLGKSYQEAVSSEAENVTFDTFEGVAADTELTEDMYNAFKIEFEDKLNNIFETAATSGEDKLVTLKKVAALDLAAQSYIKMDSPS